MPQISIIVPVYNVEPYIHRCVDSILAQTFTDFELILVDDGSPDNCAAICDEYAVKDPRISVIHKTNGGLASARNAGLEIARGAYVLFCDSDDFVSPFWCEHLFLSAEKHKQLLVFSNFYTAYPDNSFKGPDKPNYGPYSIPDFFKKNLPGFACSKAFRMKILRDNQITFPEDVIVEDLPYVLRYLAYADGLYGCEYIDYYYYHDERETLSKKYYVDGFRKWREKYASLSQAINTMIPKADQLELKGCVAQNYLFNFLRSLDNTFDSRNPASFIEKLRFNQHIIETEEFQECLSLADLSGEGKRYVKWLQRKNYLFAYGIKTLAALKRKMTGGR